MSFYPDDINNEIMKILGSVFRFVLGFLGWYLLSNIVFLMMISIVRYLPVLVVYNASERVNLHNIVLWSSIFIWLPTILITQRLIVREKGQIAGGILAAAIVNAILSIFILRGAWEWSLFPLPLSFMLMI